MKLPRQVDKTPHGDLIFDVPEAGEPGYVENVNYTLQISCDTSTLVFINYYGENDTFLSDEEVREIIDHANPD